ncbi:MAG: bacillithiol biosynthesis deacetylase BshB1 [marine benthic group bacterium]|nr:bacillithiol biosynthesis deacetylase BshB1 [Gemmatimonadota bacterium]
MTESPLDVLAIAPHPDDAELLCGGALARSAALGRRVGILDLTRGETGTKGTPEIRASEARAAAEVLGLAVRENAGLPDAGIHNTDEMRARLVMFVRRLRPDTVILPFMTGRHPDHRITAELGRDACFLAGLANYGDVGLRRLPPHRPKKVVHALAYREDPVRPTFVVGLSEEEFTRKQAAIRCYASQFEGATKAGELFPTGQDLFDLVESQGRHYGSLVRRPFGEPFWTPETLEIDDISSLGVFSL